MILQQLVKDYDRILQYGSDAGEDEEEAQSEEVPSMFEVEPVRWLIALDLSGNYLNAIPLAGGGKKDKGLPMPRPKRIRSGMTIRPFLLADDRSYVLGDVTEDHRSEEKHAEFIALTEQCAEETKLTAVNAVLTFLAHRKKSPAGLPFDNILPGEVITFEVGGETLIQNRRIAEFWSDYAGDAQKKSEPMTCMVCFNARPAIRRMPSMIKTGNKGIPGGQSSGMALISANSTVFESYGLKEATNSPLCSECAEKIMKAIKALLSNDQTSFRVGGTVAYTFWSPSKEGEKVFSNLRQPNPAEVKSLLESYQKGQQRRLKNRTAFYALALSANAARAVVRDWLTTTVGHVEDNLAQWFAWQSVPDAYGQQGKPLALFWLALSLYRKREDIEDEVVLALSRTALHGDPLPLSMLSAAVMRCRTEQNITYERAALMTLILRSRQRLETTKENFTLETPDSTVVLTHNQRAQVCGRLLAILERLQEAQADGKINSTLVDRFYGAASTAPATVFGTLLTEAQNHLTKLRKKNEGAHYGFQSLLETTLSGLDDYPPTLSVKQQALFSLGYYHQRAEMRAAAIAGKEAKNAKSASEQDDTDQLELISE